MLTTYSLHAFKYPQQTYLCCKYSANYFQTGGFCWRKVLLPVCNSWLQLEHHLDSGKDVRVLFNCVTNTIPVPYHLISEIYFCKYKKNLILTDWQHTCGPAVHRMPGAPDTVSIGTTETYISTQQLQFINTARNHKHMHRLDGHCRWTCSSHLPWPPPLSFPCPFVPGLYILLVTCPL